MIQTQSRIHLRNLRPVRCQFLAMLITQYNQFTGFSVKEALKKLAAEDAKALQQGVLPAHETSPSSFIQVGLELEEQQYVSLLFFGVYTYYVYIDVTWPLTSQLKEMSMMTFLLRRSVSLWRNGFKVGD